MMNVAPASKPKNDSTADGPWELPRGWCWTALGSIASLRKEKVSPQAHPSLPFVGMDDIERDGTSIVQTRSFGSMKSAGNRFYPGDVLYGRLRPYLNKTAVTTDHGASSGELLAIRPSETVDSRYLQLFMHARRFVNAAMSTVSGDRPRIDFATIAQFDFPLPPLAEQRRIVERIDSLFEQIAEGEAALATARKGFEIFRRALLKSAVTGELSMKWRIENPVGETGHDLLIRLAKNRGEKASRKKPGRQPAGARPRDTSALPTLPKGWAWATLGEIGEIVGGTTVDKKRKPANPSRVPYLRVANVQRGYVDLSEVKFITVDRSAAEKLRLLTGDLLLNEGGDRDKIGRGWVWDGSIPDMIHQNHVFRVRLRDSALNPFFVSHYANEMGRRFFIEEGKQTTNLASISLSKMSMLPVPVPPPAEAVEIIRLVSDALTAAADTLAIFEAEAADAMRLKQSILKAAFEGRLVGQDAAEEPAGVLHGNVAGDSLEVAAERARAGKFKV